MAQIAIRMGRVEVQATARGRAVITPKSLQEVPGGLYPLMSAAWEVDEYRIMAGWPVPVPDGDIQIECLVSAEGDLLGNRDAPAALVTDAEIRWIADDNYFDETALLWTPIQGSYSPWKAGPDELPSLISNYEYAVGDERFVDMTALNFDSNTADAMTIDLDTQMGGTSGYTVIMVLNPNSIYGNDVTVIENALWGPQTTDGNWAMFTIRDQAVWMTTESIPAQRGVAIGNALSDTAPTYLAMVVGRPRTTLYAASGPSRVLVKDLPAGPSPVPLSTRFWLGNGPFSNVGTADMALLDLGIYGNMLSRTDVVREITMLSQVYGGDS
jgi:hypothetical protein